MKIIVLDGYAANPNDLSWEGLARLGELTVYDRTPVREIPARIGDAEVVFTNKAPITRQTLAACPNVKFIGVLATGYNIVDVDACRERGVALCNVPAYSTRDVAQLTFALLLELCHHVGAHSMGVTDQGKWASQPYYCYWDYPLIELRGKTMGILGLGRIGARVSEIARAFGMDVIACSRTPKALPGVRMVDFDALLSESDVLSLNCPLNDETRGLIDISALRRMKPTALLINTARGPVVVESDLRQALDQGIIAGAAVDVLSAEPPKADDPLLKARNIIVTPHIAWATGEARARLLETVRANLAAWLRGEKRNALT